MALFNIRNDADRFQLIEEGWSWVTVIQNGPSTGLVRSRWTSREAAKHAAIGRDHAVVELSQAEKFRP